MDENKCTEVTEQLLNLLEKAGFDALASDIRVAFRDGAIKRSEFTVVEDEATDDGDAESGSAQDEDEASSKKSPRRTSMSFIQEPSGRDRLLLTVGAIRSALVETANVQLRALKSHGRVAPEVRAFQFADPEETEAIYEVDLGGAVAQEKEAAVLASALDALEKAARQ